MGIALVLLLFSSVKYQHTAYGISLKYNMYCSSVPSCSGIYITEVQQQSCESCAWKERLTPANIYQQQYY
jgi:hypothetical protein